MNSPNDDLSKFQSAFMNEIYSQDKGFHPFLADEKYQPNMGIYINNCRLILTNILKDKYPYCTQIIGDDFEYFGAKYIKQHPLDIGNVTLYGDKFAEFIAQNDFGNIRPLLHDLARIEWAKYLCEIAPFENHLDFDDFNKEILKNSVQNITASASIKFINCKTNALNLFQSIKNDKLQEFEFATINQNIVLWQNKNFEICMMLDDGFIRMVIENLESQPITDSIAVALSQTINVEQAQANFAYACESGLFIKV